MGNCSAGQSPNKEAIFMTRQINFLNETMLNRRQHREHHKITVTMAIAYQKSNNNNRNSNISNQSSHIAVTETVDHDNRTLQQ